MRVQLMSGAQVVERPRYVWIAVVLEVFTALGAVPVGVMFLSDPSGAVVQLPSGWIEATVFRTYFVPGLYLLLVNGIGMLVLAGLSVRRHWIAPWGTGALGVGLIIWILVEIVVMPATMVLTWLFLAIGLALGFIALSWLRQTGQLRV